MKIPEKNNFPRREILISPFSAARAPSYSPSTVTLSNPIPEPHGHIIFFSLRLCTQIYFFFFFFNEKRIRRSEPRKHPAVEEKEGHQARLSDMYINCGFASVKRCARPQPQHSLNSKLFHNMYNTPSTFPFCSCTVLRPAHNPFFYLFLLL